MLLSLMSPDTRHWFSFLKFDSYAIPLQARSLHIPRRLMTVAA
jgi:hypothetical protein